MGIWLPEKKYLRYYLEEKWENLRLRKWINKNPKAVMAVTGVTVLLLLIVVIAQLIPNEKTTIEEYKKLWFYDLNTGKLFTAGIDSVPPIEAPSGPLPNGEPAGVKACVLSYVDKPDESQMFIAYLETADPNYTATADSAESGNRKKGKLLRTIEDANWFAATSPQGRAVLKEAYRPNEYGESPIYTTRQNK